MLPPILEFPVSTLTNLCKEFFLDQYVVVHPTIQTLEYLIEISHLERAC